MKVHEYQAREILKKYGVPVPEADVAQTPAEARAIAEKIGGPVVIKAQVHVGGRGKAGGVKLAKNADEAEKIAGDILGMDIKGLKVEKVMVAQVVDIEKEYYVGVTLDRDARKVVVIVSSEGGVEIEAVAEKSPEKIGRSRVSPLIGLSDYVLREACFSGGIPADEVGKVVKFLRPLYKCFNDMDASLAEINPLVKTKQGDFIAIDSKINFDDNGLLRHPELKALQESQEDDPLEAEAHKRGLAYVQLSGEIGVIGNGAGLVMATMDTVANVGGKAANFLDIGGGAQADLIVNSVEVLLMNPKLKGIFFNVFGGITRCDEVAKGIVEASGKIDIPVPVVIRLSGTREEEGRQILKDNGFETVETMLDAAKKIVELSKAS